MSYADGYADVRQYNNKRRLMAALMREALKTYDDESSLFAGLPDAAQLERVAEQIEAKLESDEKIWETYMKGEEVPADQAARMLKLALLAMEAGATAAFIAAAPAFATATPSAAARSISASFSP